MQHLGFGPHWRNWVCILLSTASTRVLINGTPGPPVYHRKGLRQGDPISPMLFVLAIDVLNKLFQKAMELGVMKRLTERHMASSLSLYADDVVLFCHPDELDLSAARELLQTFGMASGLHTNLAKCSALPIQCTPAHRDSIATHFPCPIMDFPTKYLGLPLSIRKPSSNALQPYVDRLEKKLSPWWASMLSRGERLALVRHVFCAMQTHILIAMALNPTTLRRINRLVRAFLWHG